MGRLVVLVTSPRLPAGLLTGTAWRVLADAGAVLARTPGDLQAALVADGITVELEPDATADSLLARAGRTAGDVVWLGADDGDEALTQALAEVVVRRAESGEEGAGVEVMVGSFDPVGSRLLDVVTVMDRLREECPWDREQTHESLVRYLVEEAYETIEAIESGDRDHLREELGDLLLQVMFHARIAIEHQEEPFGIDEVAGEIVEKLVRRHPHVFGDTEVAGASDVEVNWETIKAEEKSRESAMEGIPPGLPALSLAAKVVSRASRADAELTVPVPGGEPAYTADTLGDVLFALVAAAHSAGIDPEQALRKRAVQEMAQVRSAEQRAIRGQPPPPG